ncbi:MAG TPA: hypothetical protein VGJ12_02390 [Gemmatimonadaceae bacterium]|jgi:hypothetical protein
MSFGKSTTCAVLIMAALTTSCGGDSTTQPGENLTTEQVQSMTGALSLLFGISLGNPQGKLTLSRHVAASQLTALTLPISGSPACPEGGHVGSNGTFSIDSAGNALFAVIDTLLDCAIKDNHSNLWTFNSIPTVAVTFEELTNIHGDSIDIANSTSIQTEVGTVHYATGTLSGTCPLDVSITYDVVRGTPTADSATFSVSTAGTVCGHTVTRDTSFVTPYTPPLT